MVKFTVEHMHKIMQKPEHIRNVAVIAHVDHGKTTLVDSLVHLAGLISESDAGKKLYMSRGDDEVKRSITIKSSSISLVFERNSPKKGNRPLLINLVDSPGHVDFSSEVTAALRVSDGALVVVDCVSGVAIQTETVLQQAIAERIKPVLFLNKLDRVFLELEKTPEDAYQIFRNTIEQVNHRLTKYGGDDPVFTDFEIRPERGMVGFGSGLHNWGFTLRDFARLHHKRFGLTKKKMMKRLWGNWCYHPILEKWVKHDPAMGHYRKHDSNLTLERGFVQFVLRPLRTLITAIKVNAADIYDPMFETFGLQFKQADRNKNAKDFMKIVMRTWLHAGKALLDLIERHTPSPVEAQDYRCEILYSGPSEDPICDHIRRCDPDGPLMMYVSQMIATSRGKVTSFIAFGRVFSGTVRPGEPVRIYGPNYVHGKAIDFHEKPIQRVKVMMGRTEESIKEIPCGNMAGVIGIEMYLKNSGTITTCQDAHPFKTMKFNVAPVVQLALAPLKPNQQHDLKSAMDLLAKTDLTLKVTHIDGQHLIAGAGELHLQTCLKRLKDLMKKSNFVVSNPVVSYREGIESTPIDPDVLISKSANKHNRLYANAQPLSREFCEAVDSGVMNLDGPMKAVSRQLRDEFDFDASDSKRLYGFGFGDSASNVLVNQTSQVQYMKEVESMVAAEFQTVVSKGVLCEEPIRGMRVNLLDAKFHAVASHRNPQIPRMVRRIVYATQLASSPVLYEPVFKVTLTMPTEEKGGAMKTIVSRRGEIDIMVEGKGGLLIMDAYLPVAESFGFVETLRGETSGKAMADMTFSHWQRVSGNPMKPGTRAHDVVMEIRKRKGLKLELPKLSEFHDRLT